MALYSREHILKERSQEWESCVEWDTRGALSMGTLFLGLGSARPQAFAPADNGAQRADQTGGLPLSVLLKQNSHAWFER